MRRDNIPWLPVHMQQLLWQMLNHVHQLHPAQPVPLKLTHHPCLQGRSGCDRGCMWEGVCAFTGALQIV